MIPAVKNLIILFHVTVLMIVINVQHTSILQYDTQCGDDGVNIWYQISHKFDQSRIWSKYLCVLYYELALTSNHCPLRQRSFSKRYTLLTMLELKPIGFLLHYPLRNLASISNSNHYFVIHIAYYFCIARYCIQLHSCTKQFMTELILSYTGSQLTERSSVNCTEYMELLNIYTYVISDYVIIR